MSRIDNAPQLFGRIAGFRVNDDLLNRQLRFAPDHLHRFRQAFPGHGSAQDIVAVDHRLQSSREPVETFARVERHQVRQQVGIAFGLHQMVEQNAFLQRRQRIDVLHVGRPARHGGRDLVNILGARFNNCELSRESAAGLLAVMGPFNFRNSIKAGLVSRNSASNEGANACFFPRMTNSSFSMASETLLSLSCCNSAAIFIF